MRIHDLNIFRVREIEHLKLDFGDKQLVAVLGENGSGKTTMLGSIIYLLCGEVIFKGGKDRMIRDVGSGDSWIAGTVSQGDKKFKIKRFVSTSACELIYLSGSSSKPIRTPTKVQIELDNMGLTAEKVVRTLLEQGKYGGLFHSADGDRLRQMFEIFGLTDSDEMQEAVGAEAALVPIDVTIDERWEVAKAKLAEAALALNNTTIEKVAAAADYTAVADARKILAQSNEAEAAAAEINKLRGGRDVIAKQVESLADEITALSAEQAELDAGVAAMEADNATAEQVVAAATTYKALAAGVAAQVETLTTAGGTLRECRATLAALPEVVPGAIVSKRMQIETARSGIATREATIAAVKRLESVKVATVTTTKKRTDLVAKAAFFPGNLYTEITRVTEDQRLLREQVALAKSGVCPTCKQRLPTAHECLPLDQAQQMLAGCTTTLEELTAKAREHEALLQGISTCDTLLGEYAKQIAAENVPDADVVALNGEIAALRQTIDAINSEITAIESAATRRAELNTKISGAEAAFNAAQAYVARVDAAKVDQQLVDGATTIVAMFRQRKASADAGKGVLANQVERLRKARLDLEAADAALAAFKAVDVIDPVVVENARALAANAAAIEAKWLEVNTAAGVAEAANRVAEQEFSTLDVLKKQNEANKRKHDLINDIKFLVGVKQFPMFVAGFYVQAVNALWARELEVMDTKFSAWQDETTLEFYATFHGGDQTRMLYQLSGGERQLASIGYQVVINRLFAAGVDWIAFDEPTTHVDAAYRPALVQAFLRMMQREELKDTQMFVVDHSVEFTNAISDPIVLVKGG